MATLTLPVAYLIEIAVGGLLLQLYRMRRWHSIKSFAIGGAFIGGTVISLWTVYLSKEPRFEPLSLFVGVAAGAASAMLFRFVLTFDGGEI
jgi:hypothetical protein